MTTTPAPASPRPAIVTIDDDPSVSRSVARDLRRRYGERYRIVRAESGPQALEALHEMKLRGEDVALLLADHRMPQMTGVEFLERAMDVYPNSRRILLTAYADTDAAIDAINVVDLDHYLLKPWDPPEEKLYPVLDDQLTAWKATDRSRPPEIKVIGHRYSARSTAVREFLTRNQVGFHWYLCDGAEAQALLTAAGADENRLPVLITESGEVLVEPTDAQVAAAVGLETRPAQEFYDLAVIGAGPAGLGAAVYGASEGLRTILIERTAAGGQAGTSSMIENYLGFPDGVSGDQLTARARLQARRFGAEFVTAREVTAIEPHGAARTVRFADGGALNAQAIVLATGVTYRALEAPGLHEFTGRGVYYGASPSEARNCKDADVYLVGGANSAGQAAVNFAAHARSVTLLVRGTSLENSMSYYLIQRLGTLDNVTVRTCSEVTGGTGSDHLEELTIRDNITGATESVKAQWLFVFIGAAPRTDWLDGVVQRDARGFILAGPDLPMEGPAPRGWSSDRLPYHLETSVPGVFVAGDARAESAKRVASAVGEGAMAVMLVHRYLEGR